MDKCILCGKEVKITDTNDIYSYECQRCGKVEITYEMSLDKDTLSTFKHILSG